MTVRKKRRRRKVLKSKKPFRPSAGRDSDGDDNDSENVNIDAYNSKKSVQKKRRRMMCFCALQPVLCPTVSFCVISRQISGN
jgi:hypothetical protein